MTLQTEKEARAKWCPNARVMMYEPQVEQNPPVNRQSNDCNCYGSLCMAWRWFDTLSDDGTQCQLKPTPHAKRNPLPPLRPLNERRGYCGAFGKVEP